MRLKLINRLWVQKLSHSKIISIETDRLCKNFTFLVHKIAMKWFYFTPILLIRAHRELITLFRLVEITCVNTKISILKLNSTIFVVVVVQSIAKFNQYYQYEYVFRITYDAGMSTTLHVRRVIQWWTREPPHHSKPITNWRKILKP